MTLFMFSVSRACGSDYVGSLRRAGMRAFVIVCLGVCVHAVCSDCCFGQGRYSPLVERRVEEVLRRRCHETGAAGLAFGVSQNGVTVVECYAGYASWADKKRIDAASVFRWASLSKGLTAVCALKMAENRQLDLDAAISAYLPELEPAEPITLRQILCHQGGIGGYETYRELLELDEVEPSQMTGEMILERMRYKKPVFAPGSCQGYSSPGYILLSLAMERAARKSFAAIVDEIVAKPLKLSSLRVGGKGEADVVRYCVAHGSRESIDGSSDDWRLGAGAVRSNLGDALAFAASLVQSSILSPESTKELLRRRSSVVTSGASQAVAGMGYGFMRIGLSPDAPIVADGIQAGVRSSLAIYPRSQMITVMFCNTTPVNLVEIQLEVMKALVER